MIDLILFCFAVIGLTDIMIDSRIRDIIINSSWYAPVKSFFSKVLPSYVYELLECHQCLGTWNGFILGCLLLGTDKVTILSCGLAGSFICKFFSTLHVCMDVWYMNNMHTEIKVPDEDDNE